MRRPSACTTCRARRRKCYIAPGEETCAYCVARGLECVREPPQGGYYHLTQGSRGSQPVNSQPAAENHARGLLPPLRVRMELVRLYFRYCHGQFHALFHPQTFKTAIAEDRVPHVILYPLFALCARWALIFIGLLALLRKSISNASCILTTPCAVSTTDELKNRFSTDSFFSNTNPPDRGAALREEGCKLLDIRDVSLTTVQACVLLGAAHTADKDVVSENLYYAIACRIAQLLDLPNRPVSSLLERESNIRVWWSLCMSDVWSSTAVKLPLLMPKVEVPLPIDELQYLALRQDSAANFMETVSVDGPSPLLSEMIKLNRILVLINDFNERCVKDRPDGLLLEHAIHGLSRRLDDWVAELPDNLRDTDENFAWYASRGLGRIFAAVYLGYYHFGQLLFYQFLHNGFDRSVPSANAYAEKCKGHAAHLCEMVYRSFATPNCDVLYPMVAHVLTIASTVQIHTLLFSGHESQIRVARSRLERNFELLLHLRQYWSTLDGVMVRLHAFHDMCQKSMDTSFVLDHWMLSFLVEFHNTMDEQRAADSRTLSAYWTLDGIRARKS